MLVVILARRFTRRRMQAPIVSQKNMPNGIMALTTANTIADLATAVTAPSNTVQDDVGHGSIIKAIWVSIDLCGLGPSGTLVRGAVYLMKNPGNNLTPPGAFTVGTSNEKKFCIRYWNMMLMRNQDGNPGYHWEGWIKIPKVYQRMGVDDTWELIAGLNAQTGHLVWQAIYKWFS